MKNIIILASFYLFVTMNSFSQGNKEEIYIVFDGKSTEVFEVENGDGNLIKRKKFRKNISKSKIDFYIGSELFRLYDFKKNIDSCKIKEVNDIKYKDLNYIKEKYKKSKSNNFFKNSVFGKIYLVERKKNCTIKYKVSWITDLIEN